MGLVRSFKWVNGYGRTLCRRLFWRTRAAVRRAVSSGGKKQKLKFEYDPLSYALNFNDGFSKFEEETTSNDLIFQVLANVITTENNVVWIIVICPNSK